MVTTLRLAERRQQAETGLRLGLTCLTYFNCVVMSAYNPIKSLILFSWTLLPRVISLGNRIAF